MRAQGELKARLAALENQITALQAEITGETPNFDGISNLKQILMSNKRAELLFIFFSLELKAEHQSVLENIDQALRLVESQSSPVLFGSSPLRPALRDRITAAALGSPSPVRSQQPRHFGSSPLTPSVEKSHITFDILRDLENKRPSFNTLNNSSQSSKHVRFNPHSSSTNTNSDLDLSLASQEYLKKYNLI